MPYQKNMYMGEVRKIDSFIFQDVLHCCLNGHQQLSAFLFFKKCIMEPRSKNRDAHEFEDTVVIAEVNFVTW